MSGAAAKVDIYNLALSACGVTGNLVDPDGDNEKADVCNTHYESARCAALALHPWNFALKRAKLNRDAIDPDFGYAYRFRLPDDCIRFIATKEQMERLTQLSPSYNGYLTISRLSAFPDHEDYSIEDGYLLSDREEVRGLYIYDHQVIAKWSALFVKVMSLTLGAEIAYRLTNSSTMKETLLKQAEETLRRGRAVDGQEGRLRRKQSSSWAASRRY
ncbi:MAG: hypothetical protein K2Q12_11110 [Rickettsiales bacterium]|nr:hypothetical protein [Rickettsiales bacterium]